METSYSAVREPLGMVTLLTSSEVELMETWSMVLLYHGMNSSDFLGS